MFSIAAFSVASLLTMIVTTSGREAAFWLLLLPPPSSISVIDRPSLDTHSAPLIASKRIFCVQKNLLDVKAFLLKPYTFIYKYIAAVVGPMNILAIKMVLWKNHVCVLFAVVQSLLYIFSLFLLT